jgi:hypothetical protein
MSTSVLAPTRAVGLAHSRNRVPPSVNITVAVVAIGAGSVGLFSRLWFIFHTPTNSDLANVGLIAQNALHGHFTAFYGGQAYGGTAEPYLIAFAFLVFGQTGVVAELVVGALTAAAAILTWRIALRLVSPKVALLAGALVWTAPAVAIRDSVRVFGFRGVTLVCGLGLILVALQLLDGQRGLARFAALGLLAGVGWWSSPEIVYYAIPTGLLFGAAVVRSPGWRTWWPGGLVAIGAALVGTMPWIWANVGSGFASLHSGKMSSSSTFGGRLGVFFHYVFPMEVGLRRADSGAWVLGAVHTLALVVVMAALVVALLLCLVRGGRALAFALALMAFPILYAISPATWAWQDGRYAGYLVPLLALVLAIGSCEAVKRVGDPRAAAAMVMASVVALSVILAVVGLRQLINAESGTFTTGWGNPDTPTLAAISKLEGAGITTGYANYFVAYKLDFLSQGRLKITTAGYENDRSLAINGAVAHSSRPAWLFVPPREATVDGTQFAAPQLIVGPDTVTEAEFTATLHQLGVGYRVVDTGIVRAVIPNKALTPYEAKMPGAVP